MSEVKHILGVSQHSAANSNKMRYHLDKKDDNCDNLQYNIDRKYYKDLGVFRPANYKGPFV